MRYGVRPSTRVQSWCVASQAFQGYQIGLIDLVDRVLHLCLSHHDQLRTNAVQILYTMIVSDYHRTGDFVKIETELINKLDELFMAETKTDDVSRAFFIKQLRHLFDSAAVDDRLRTRVNEFLGSVDLFLELLLSVRELPEGDEYQDDRVIATLRLMNFIRRIGRDEIYIKYVHQLVNVSIPKELARNWHDDDEIQQMHIRSHNYVEAALTLKLHSDLHEWDLMSFVNPLPDLDLPRQSSFVRKETLCLLILDYLGEFPDQRCSLFKVSSCAWFREREGLGKRH
jgi:dedicator of cytokinesis protein 3